LGTIWILTRRGCKLTRRFPQNFRKRFYINFEIDDIRCSRFIRNLSNQTSFQRGNSIFKLWMNISGKKINTGCPKTDVEHILKTDSLWLYFKRSVKMSKVWWFLNRKSFKIIYDTAKILCAQIQVSAVKVLNFVIVKGMKSLKKHVHTGHPWMREILVLSVISKLYPFKKFYHSSLFSLLKSFSLLKFFVLKC